LGRRVLKLSLCDPCLYLGEKIKFPCCRSPFPWGRKFKFKRLEIFLAFWCAQNRGLPRANFPIGEVILPLAKWNFKLKNLKVFFCMLQMVYKDFFCMMQMVYKEFKPLPYWDEPLLLGRHFLGHVFFQVSPVIFCWICFMWLVRVLSLGCYLDSLWWVTIVSLPFRQQIVE
jgi:hypothetical protein